MEGKLGFPRIFVREPLISKFGTLYFLNVGIWRAWMELLQDY